MSSRGSSPTFPRFLSVFFAVLSVSVLLTSSLARAEDHNFDMGAGGDLGVPTAWDSESVNPLSGNLHLSIPLYRIESGPDFSMSLALEYNSISWDPADLNYHYQMNDTYPAIRYIKGRGPSGMGWRLSIPRVRRYTYHPGSWDEETYYYYQAADGGMHPLHRERCISGFLWFANDDSGIRAKSYSDAYEHIYRWEVWEPSGTKSIMEHYYREDLYRGMPAVGNADNWDAIRIESAARLTDANNSAAQWIDIVWENPNIPHDGHHWYCPQSMTDSNGRSISIECESGPQPYQLYQDGGRIKAIEVLGTSDAAGRARRIRYSLTHEYRTIVDPFTTMPCPIEFPDCPSHTERAGILVLTGIEATVPEVTVPEGGGEGEPIDPVMTFAFGYNQSGMLTSEVLPGGGQRSYDYGFSYVWKRDFPSAFTFPTIAIQFEHLPLYALRRRSLIDGQRAWHWNYSRLNEPCSEANTIQCFDHSDKVVVTGPACLLDASVQRSTTIYRYRATARDGTVTDGTTITPGQVSALDGTLASVEVYAGNGATARLLRRTQYEYTFEEPERTSCHPKVNFKNHYADSVRMSREITTIEDDRKPIHDSRVVEYTDWDQLDENVWAPKLVNEYLADGTTLYRRAKASYEIVTNPNGAHMPRQSWAQVVKGDATPLQESRYTYNIYGQTDSIRRLYAPTSTPGTLSSNDLVTTIVYDPATGFPIHVDIGTGAAASQYQAEYVWDSGLLVRRHQMGVTWNSLDQVRDFRSGAVLQERQPWGDAYEYVRDTLGRTREIHPLSGTVGPSVTMEHTQNQTVTVIGDLGAPTSLQQIEMQDGLGRVSEERALKYDDSILDQWVSRTFVRDWSGAVETESQWAPVGSPSIEGPRTERYGLYKSSEADPGVLAVDPTGRVRKVVGPNGSSVTWEHVGLVTRTTKYGLQGGDIDMPVTFDQLVEQTSDIFGRSRSVAPPIGAVTTTSYDELNRPGVVLRTDNAVTQTRETRYDPLGRVTLLREPERGTIWFGSHVADVVQPDGYNALGGVLRYQTGAGAADPNPYHYLLTYDLAGRLTLAEKEADAGGGTRTKIGEFVYDLSANGDGDSHNGRLGRAISYDDNGGMRFQTDYNYQEASGRLDRTISKFGAWQTPQTTYYGYDSMGLVSSVGYPTTQPPGSAASSSVTIQRMHGYSQSVQSNRGPIVTGALYDHGGMLKQWNAGSGVKTLLVPDVGMQGRIQEFKVTNAAGSVLWTTGHYEFDGGGSIKTIGTDQFVYDVLGRLHEARMPGPTGSPLYQQTYSYDAFGNLYGKALQVNNGLPEGALFNIDLATNRIRGLDQATNWTYRDDGALTHDDAFDYSYDNAGRLAEIQQGGMPLGQYGYDATGKRVYREEDHGKEIFYFRGLDDELLSQFSRPAGSTATPQWDRDFMYLNAQRVAMVENPVPGGPNWRLTSSGGSGISLNWFSCPDSDVYGYVVYRKAPGEPEYTPLYAAGQAITTSGTSYTNTGVTSGATYWYKVACVDTAGNEGPSSPERPITHLDTVAPPAPTALSAVAGNAIVTLQWAPPSTPPNDFAGYYVYRSLTSGVYTGPLNAYPILAASYQDLAVTNGTTYYYIVRSVDTAGVLSAASNPVNAKPKVFQQTRLLRLEDEGLGVSIASGLGDSSCEGFIMPYRTIGQGVPFAIVFLHHDHLGTLRYSTDMNGLQKELHKYLPYGEEAQVLASGSPFRYAGYEFDAESRMHYVGARYLAEGRARWLTPDPLGEGYEYGLSNPVRYTDPTGLSAGLVCTYACVCTSAKSGDEIEERDCTCEQHCTMVGGADEGPVAGDFPGPWMAGNPYWNGRISKPPRPAPPIRVTPNPRLLTPEFIPPPTEKLLQQHTIRDAFWKLIADALGVGRSIIGGSPTLGGVVINPCLVGGSSCLGREGVPQRDGV